MIRRKLIRLLGGEGPYEYPDDDQDYYDGDDDVYPWQQRLVDVFRRHNKGLAQVMEYGGQEPHVVDVSKAIAMLDPDESQFTSMLMKLPLRPGPLYYWNEDKLSKFIGNFEGQWWAGFEWEDDWELESDRRAAYEARRDEAVKHFGQYVVIAGAYQEGMTIEPGTGKFARLGDIVRNTATGEVMRVTAMNEYGPTEVERWPRR